MKKINLFKKETVNGITYDRKNRAIKTTIDGVQQAELLPNIVVNQLCNFTIGNTIIEYGIADELIVGVYASGKSQNRKGEDKSMKLQKYEPVVVTAMVGDEFKIIIRADVAKKKEKANALATYFYAKAYPGKINAEVMKRVKTITGIDTVENGQKTTESATTDQGNRMTAYVEATSVHGKKFIGYDIFGMHIGGVAKIIQKDENDKLRDIARKVDTDRKRMYKQEKKSFDNAAKEQEDIANKLKSIDAAEAENAEASDTSNDKKSQQAKKEDKKPEQAQGQTQGQTQTPDNTENVEG